MRSDWRTHLVVPLKCFPCVKPAGATDASKRTGRAAGRRSLWLQALSSQVASSSGQGKWRLKRQDWLRGSQADRLWCLSCPWRCSSAQSSVVPGTTQAYNEWSTSDWKRSTLDDISSRCFLCTTWYQIFLTSTAWLKCFLIWCALCLLQIHVCPVIMSFFFSTENQWRSEALHIFLGRLYDPQQTNKRTSHSGFSEEMETFWFPLNELSFQICSLGSLNSTEVRGQKVLFESSWALEDWSSGRLTHCGMPTDGTIRESSSSHGDVLGLRWETSQMYPSYASNWLDELKQMSTSQGLQSLQI